MRRKLREPSCERKRWNDPRMWSHLSHPLEVGMQTSILGIFATLWHRSPHTSRGTTGKTQNFCT